LSQTNPKARSSRNKRKKKKKRQKKGQKPKGPTGGKNTPKWATTWYEGEKKKGIQEGVGPWGDKTEKKGGGGEEGGKRSASKTMKESRKTI